MTKEEAADKAKWVAENKPRPWEEVERMYRARTGERLDRKRIVRIHNQAIRKIRYILEVLELDKGT